MDAELVEMVWRRAHSRCEYCQLAQELSQLTFEIDHIVARKHGGKARSSNLALSCFYCNSFKGSNIAGLDRETGKLTRLFHPRIHTWHHHFRWEGPYLDGRTAIGRTTIDVLLINLELRVAHRRLLVDAQRFPPD